MNPINKALQFLGKDDIKIDETIPKSYIIRICIHYGLMLMRGSIRCLLFRGMPFAFLGSGVHLICSKRLHLGKGVRLDNNVYIDALSRNDVVLGNRVLIGRNGRIECTGSLTRVGNGLKIGDRSTFGPDCYFGAAGGIEVGCDVIAGQNVRFHSENHVFSRADVIIRKQGVTHEGIQVGDNCWIGSGAVFLDGASVGDGCVIAANAVVTKRFPNNVVIGGVPAKIIKTRVTVDLTAE